MKVVKVPSTSQKGVVYDVRILDTGEYRCSCPNFVLGGNKECKHILKVKNKTEEPKRDIAKEIEDHEWQRRMDRMQEIIKEKKHEQMVKEYGSPDKNR